MVFLMEHAPGAADPIKLLLGSKFTPGSHAVLLHQYNLDVPVWQQYLNYVGISPMLGWFGIHFGHGGVQTGLLEGNLGYSYHYIQTPTWTCYLRESQSRSSSGGYSLVLSLIIGLPIGMISALKQTA